MIAVWIFFVCNFRQEHYFIYVYIPVLNVIHSVTNRVNCENVKCDCNLDIFWIVISDNVTKKAMIAMALGIVVLIFLIIAVVVRYRRRYEL